jgi:hypothetical protein
MTTKNVKRLRLIITLIILASLTLGTFLAIQYAKGYRPSLTEKGLNGLGLLSATSYPKSAQVFIDDRLTTATDDTLYLNPGNYTVIITKDGFSPWTKKFPISTELVSATDARLFPSLPSISPLTYNGAENISISPDNTKIIFVSKNAPINTDNGVFILSLNSLTNNFLGNSQITQIADLATYDYTKSRFFWSPDSSQVLAVFTDSKNQISASHLLSTKSMNKSKDLNDTTTKLSQITTDWQQQIERNNANLLTLLPDYLIETIKGASNVFFSPDQEKILFTATKDSTLPENPLRKSLPSLNPTPENRDLKQNSTYVFDLKEGTNYQIKAANPLLQSSTPLLLAQEISPTPTATTSAKLTTTPTKKPTPTPTPNPKESTLSILEKLAIQSNPLLTNNLVWYSTSRHLVIVSKEEVAIIEYDGNNQTTLFQTNIENSIALPSPDGQRLIILTNLNQKNTSPNLFSLDLK